jgi:tRNA(Ile)-lysidine synthase
VSKSAASADTSSVSVIEAKALFSAWQNVPVIVLAVSGGPDSTALLWLAARWRKARKRGPKLIAVTVDHGLRPEAKTEARAVKRLAETLGVEHRTLSWRGAKPTTGLQAAARMARYALMAKAARQAGATHIMTAHSRDDQAETVLMRLARGSGIGGLAAMSRESVVPTRDTDDASTIVLARPLLDIPKARLVATLHVHKIGFAEDASNEDPRFTRVRWRGLMPPLAAEGLDSWALSRLSRRAGRAEEALALAALGAERALVEDVRSALFHVACDAAAFAKLPAEIRLRLVGRMIARVGGEGAPELGKLEALMDALDEAISRNVALRRTLAGSIVSVDKRWISASRAPARRVHAPKGRKRATRAGVATSS